MTKSIKINIKNSNTIKENKRKSRTRGTIHSCAHCNGTGTIYSLMDGNIPCPVCKGKGKNRI